MSAPTTAGKKSLGTVVECAESTAEETPMTAAASLPISVDMAKSRPRKEERRRTLGGSRLSLASLFSFSSQGRDRLVEALPLIFHLASGNRPLQATTGCLWLPYRLLFTMSILLLSPLH